MNPDPSHTSRPDPAGQPAGVPAALPAAAVLPQALQSWCERLQGVGVACKDLAFINLAPWGSRGFGGVPHAVPTEPESPSPPGADEGPQAVWRTLLARLSPQQPVVLARSGPDLVMACLMSSSGQAPAVLGCLIAPPHNERIIQLVQMALGWLQVSLSADALARGQRAARLLEALGHVLSQDKARAAAQDWINRTAAWVREGETDTEAASIGLSLFEVVGGLPRWWVSSDVAWMEQGAPLLQEAQEMAARAVADTQEQSTGRWWALPLLDGGEVRAVLVARLGDGAQSLSSGAADILRASAGVAEPVLRRWQVAERALWRHALDASAETARRFRGPGHWALKAGAGLVLAAVLALTLWPVDDRVKANLVIEGSTRQVVTAPFDGFWRQVLVRPGDRVRRGQVMARLDERDLLLERAKQQSAQEQAEGRLRQALGEREPAAASQMAAELRQAQAQLQLVETRLSRAAMLAPLDGVVVSGDWAQQIGAPVENGKELFELAAEDGYKVVLHVADADIARLRAGQPGSLRLTGQPGQSHGFVVTRITAMASVRDGLNGFRVEARWDGAAPVLSPGMQGVGKIVVGQTNLITAWTRPMVDWARMKLWSFW